jgi:hypothetical protein
MKKRLVAKVGSYTNNQGEQKGEYVNVGVLLENQNGEYLLLDPSINIAGLLMKQNLDSGKQNKSLAVSIFDDSNRQQGQSYNNQQQPQQQQGYAPQQQQPQNFPQPQQTMNQGNGKAPF